MSKDIPPRLESHFYKERWQRAISALALFAFLTGCQTRPTADTKPNSLDSDSPTTDPTQNTVIEPMPTATPAPPEPTPSSPPPSFTPQIATPETPTLTPPPIPEPNAPITSSTSENQESTDPYQETFNSFKESYGLGIEVNSSLIANGEPIFLPPFGSDFSYSAEYLKNNPETRNEVFKKQLLLPGVHGIILTNQSNGEVTIIDILSVEGAQMSITPIDPSDQSKNPFSWLSTSILYRNERSSLSLEEFLAQYGYKLTEGTEITIKIG